MKKTLIGLLTPIASSAVLAQTVNFDDDATGSPPAGWICGVTGGGSPRWAVAADPSAPSKPNVLVQAGSGTFPWCVKSGTALTDGFIEVKFKPIAGREDRAGGLVWRWIPTAQRVHEKRSAQQDGWPENFRTSTAPNQQGVPEPKGQRFLDRLLQ